MMFATFVQEKDPLQVSDLPSLTLAWVQHAGVFAALAIVVWLLARLLSSRGQSRPDVGPTALSRIFILLAAVAAIAYVSAGILLLIGAQDTAPSVGQPAQAAVDTSGTANLIAHCRTVGGAAALLAVMLPFLVDLFKLRGRRVWALARLSFKEALRRRVLWAFSFLIIALLFITWFIDSKAENQVRNYVRVLYWLMTPLLLVTAGLLAAFSLPADIKNQTIYTIVTKPVERFEIVIGRFLGYVMLMTLIMLVLTAVSLVYMLREIHPDARFEGLRARVPIYGDLRFLGTTEEKGDSVGREWDYRRFIAGGANSPQRAIWAFHDVPASLASRAGDVGCEFNFDVFRTTKGEEGKGVFCTLVFQTWRYDPRNANEYTQEYDRLARQGGDPAKVSGQLAEKFGFYVVRSKQIFDYHTQAITIPPGLFKNAREGAEKRPNDPNGQKVAPLEVTVKCESPSQYMGMAKYDLYVLDSEGWFGLNFFKGAIGLWLRLCVVIGLAVTLSTYLSGIISFLTTMILFLFGYFQDFIRKLAENKSEGGGPMESLVRLVNKENMIKTLDETPGSRLALGSDYIFRFLFQALLDIIPDVERFDFTDHVAEGFNISGGQLLVSLLILAGYLLPCALLAYYLLKTREVAA